MINCWIDIINDAEFRYVSVPVFMGMTNSASLRGVFDGYNEHDVAIPSIRKTLSLRKSVPPEN